MIFTSEVSIFQNLETWTHKEDLSPYFPASASEINASSTVVHYLGYYLKWTPQECYYYAVDNVNFESNPERTEGTFSKYNSIDDKIDGFHYWTTYIKFGIGRATYDAAQEIRNGHLTRDEGVALVKRYDGEFPQRSILTSFCNTSLSPKMNSSTSSTSFVHLIFGKKLMTLGN